MSTLLLALVGPMQSWGIQSDFDHRDTGLEPSKSGVVGLLCAALGWPRAAPLDDLAALRMGVRVDREGQLLCDYHTAGQGGFLRAEGKVEAKKTILSNRYYLADAAFLVGLEGDVELLQRLRNALRRPRWPLFLGRKAFVPALPPGLPDGLRDEGLESALSAYSWLGCDRREHRNLVQLRLVIETGNGPLVRLDQPESFALRRFRLRRVGMQFVAPPPFDWRLAGLLGTVASSREFHQ